jgi:hypothetical protein
VARLQRLMVALTRLQKVDEARAFEALSQVGWGLLAVSGFGLLVALAVEVRLGGVRPVAICGLRSHTHQLS